MNRLLIRLWSVLEGEDSSSINYQIAQTLLQNADSIKHTSTAALAKFCNVSKPSISRFCKNIGYDDFYDFRAELNQFLPDRGAKYLLPGETDDKEWARQYLDGVQKSVDKLRDLNVQSEIESLAKDICAYPRVYLVGNMQSGQTAESLQRNLHGVKKNIQAVTSFSGRTQIFEKHKENTLFIVFSVSGEYFRALFLSGQCPKQAATSRVWMVTTNPFVKKVDGVDKILNLRTGTDLASSNICLEMVANLLAFYYWNYFRS